MPPPNPLARAPLARALCASALALALGACATARPAGPVEVTRFVAPTTAAQLGQGTIFVDSAAGGDGATLENAPFKAAVARELAELGYRETARGGAGQVAEVRVNRFVLEADGDRRGPVSVGVGGGTGSYGSGVGLGVGINLGGGGSRERIGTELEVRIRDVASSSVLWEGRAEFDAPRGSALAEPQAAANAIATALFSRFPGNNGETIEVEIE